MAKVVRSARDENGYDTDVRWDWITVQYATGISDELARAR